MAATVCEAELCGAAAVTGASTGYAFCEYESERGFTAAFKGCVTAACCTALRPSLPCNLAHNSMHGVVFEGAKLLVDVERGRLMPGTMVWHAVVGLGG